MLVTTAVAYLLWLKDVGEIAISMGDRRGGGEGGDSSIASQGHLLSPWKFTGCEYTSGTLSDGRVDLFFRQQFELRIFMQFRMFFFFFSVN